MPGTTGLPATEIRILLPDRLVARRRVRRCIQNLEPEPGTAAPGWNLAAGVASVGANLSAAAVEKGLALARSMPYPYAEGRLLHVCGRLHLAKGEAESAHTRLEAALVIFRRLGARKAIMAAEQLLVTLD